MRWLCLFLGHNWRPVKYSVDLGPGIEFYASGRTCVRCRWSEQTFAVSGLSDEQDLILRSGWEKLEAKLAAESGSLTWRTYDADEFPA